MKKIEECTIDGHAIVCTGKITQMERTPFIRKFSADGSRQSHQNLAALRVGDFFGLVRGEDGDVRNFSLSGMSKDHKHPRIDNDEVARRLNTRGICIYRFLGNT